MKLRVLGSFEVTTEGRRHSPSGPKLRQVLALLSMRSGQVVSRDSLIEELWGSHPPKTATTTLQTYIYHLRKWLQQFAEISHRDSLLQTRAPGYVLALPKENVDASAFLAKLHQGRAQIGRGEAADAAVTLRSALDLWSGPVLADVTCGSLLHVHVTHLEEKRIAALEQLVSAEMQLGRHRELIAELRSLVITHPLNESFHAQLIIALNRSRRRGEALQAYHGLRSTLQDELGLDPSNELQRLHLAVLNSDDDTFARPEPAAVANPRLPYP